MLRERLESVINELPMLRQMFEQDVYITVIDRDGIIRGFSLPDGATPIMKVGDRFVDPTGAFQEVIATGRPKKNHLPKEVMGETFEGMLVPIKDGSEVAGCMTCTYSVDIKEQNVEIAAQFKESVHDINNSIQTIVSGIENLFEMLTAMSEVSGHVESDVNTASEVVGKISSNASRSNILALNASIEAARSGEHGRGFAVVATEMGKLSKDSGSSATEIKATLNTITGHMVSIISSIKDANNVAKEQMENVGAIQKILQETVVLAEKLEKNVKV